MDIVHYAPAPVSNRNIDIYIYTLHYFPVIDIYYDTIYNPLR